MNSPSVNRRDFLSSGALALSGLAMGLPLISKALSPNDVINIGLIGSGKRGVVLAKNMRALPGLKLVACCDVQSSNLANAMAHAVKGAKSYTDYRELLNDKSIDAVIIATPLFLHYPMTIDSLSAGKHVYVEKSMTYDIPQSVDLVKKVNNSGLILQVGFQYRNYELYHTVKKIIDQNWLGKITSFESHYNRNASSNIEVSDPNLEHLVNWRLYKKYCGGPLTELSAHQIDAINFLLNSHPISAIANGGINYWKDGRDTYDNIHAIYEYPQGIKSSVTSLLSNGHDGYSIRILGDRATVEILRNTAFIYPEKNQYKQGIINEAGETLPTQAKGGIQQIMIGKPGEKFLSPNVNAFIDFESCIRNKKKPISNVETGRDSSIAVHMGNIAAETESIQRWKSEYSI